MLVTCMSTDLPHLRLCGLRWSVGIISGRFLSGGGACGCAHSGDDNDHCFPKPSFKRVPSFVPVINLQQDDEDDDEEEVEVSQGRNEPPSTAFWKQALF